jgi:hypothetical protein
MLSQTAEVIATPLCSDQAQINLLRQTFMVCGHDAPNSRFSQFCNRAYKAYEIVLGAPHFQILNSFTDCQETSFECNVTGGHLKMLLPFRQSVIATWLMREFVKRELR